MENEIKMKNFSIETALSWGWNTTKNNFGFILLVILIYNLVSFIPSATTNMNESASLIPMLLSFAVFVVIILMKMGITKMMLEFYEGRKPEIKEIIYTKNVLEYFVVSLLYVLMVLVGFILLIIPGIYLALRYQFAPILVIDKGMKPLEALKKSAQMTEGLKWKLLLFHLACIGINILGMIALLIGLLLTTPTTMLASTHVYKKLLEDNP